ncbi:MAG: YlbF family regulator [Clostridia bacterium]|nr:YlbF family regulator [Clostridia bacterium]
MVYDKANELAQDIKNSEEYREFKTTKEKAFENQTTASLIKEYHKLQITAQAAMVTGNKDDESLQRLQKIGELLQMNHDASAFLMAEYRLNRMVSDIYKILAEAIDVDLGMLEE